GGRPAWGGQGGWAAPGRSPVAGLWFLIAGFPRPASSRDSPAPVRSAPTRGTPVAGGARDRRCNGGPSRPSRDTPCPDRRGSRSRPRGGTARQSATRHRRWGRLVVGAGEGWAAGVV